MSHYRTTTYTRRHSNANKKPFVAFLMIACFGLLFVGCGGETQEEPTADEFVFTEQDIEEFREMVKEAEQEQAASSGALAPIIADGEDADVLQLDLSKRPYYESLRVGSQDGQDNTYRVTNEFLNVRDRADVRGAVVSTLDEGDTFTVLDFVNAAWAHVRLFNEVEGYVSTRYIAKLVAEENLKAEKDAFDGLWFVDFGFLNVRKSADTGSEKLGELPGQAIVKPLSMDDVWARILFEGEEGYVAQEYLSPFTPNFLVRQEQFSVPIVSYSLTQADAPEALEQHIRALEREGRVVISMQRFADVLFEQENRDVRIDPQAVVLIVTGLTNENIDAVSDALIRTGSQPTLAIETRHVGIDGITEKDLLTLKANGFDIQSSAHTGDDLRSLTNTQVELELKQSRKLLEEMTDGEVLAVLYPMGGVNERVIEKAQESGYLFGVARGATTSFRREEFLRLPSIAVTPDMTNAELIDALSPEQAVE